ncbi:unnamed protein product, partial [Discosporangium mesarthrocarpum]
MQHQHGHRLPRACLALIVLGVLPTLQNGFCPSLAGDLGGRRGSSFPRRLKTGVTVYAGVRSAMPVTPAEDGGRIAENELRVRGRRPGRGAGRGSGRRKGRASGYQEADVSRWRLFNVEVPLEQDPGKDEWRVTAEVVEAVAAKLGAAKKGEVEACNMKVVRKSFDARVRKDGQPKFVYTIDVDVSLASTKKLRLRTQQGKIEPAPTEEHTALGAAPGPMDHRMGDNAADPEWARSSPPLGTGQGQGSGAGLPRVVVVGSGPAGLFAALELTEAGLKPTIVERGRPVERRGRDVGALFVRGILDPDSNLCYGEGGAGTWSDGKLTTRIGRNSREVRKVCCYIY